VSDRDALLAAIAAHPDEDTPRLAFADWLDEHATSNADHARAEFIRIQIERSHLDEDDDRQAELEARERRLITTHGATWPTPNVLLQFNTYTRGFVERFHAWADNIFSLPPELEEGEEPKVNPDEDPPWVVKLFASAPIRELCFDSYGFLDGYDPEKARNWQFFSRIESLDACNDGQRSHELTDLLPILASLHLTRLKRLDIGGNPDLGDEGVRRILELPSVQNLEYLRISETRIGDAGLDALLARPWPHLQSLDLAGNAHLSAAALRRLFDSDLWPRLRTINLSRLQRYEPRHEDLARGIERMEAELLQLTNFGGEWGEGPPTAARALLAAKTWGPLRHLALGQTGTGLEELRQLLLHPSMAGVTALSLGENPLPAEAMDLIAAAPNLGGLKRLNIRENAGAGFRLHLLAESPYLTGLTHLCAGGTGEGLIEFVRSPNAAHLQWLSLDGAMSDELAEAIAGSPYMGRLTTLRGEGQFTDRGALAFAQSPHLKCLTFLHSSLKSLKLTTVGQQALLSAEHLGWVGIMDPKGRKAKELYKRRYGKGYWDQLVPSDTLYWV
jgi:uncharacterized protein (TIGR02996 family)